MDLFGDGSIYDLEKSGNQKAFDNRTETAKEVLRMYRSRQEEGLPPLPMGVVVKRAVNALFADEIKKQSQTALQQRLTANAGRRLGAPGGKAPVVPAPKQEDYDPLQDQELLAEVKAIKQRD